MIHFLSSLSNQQIAEAICVIAIIIFFTCRYFYRKRKAGRNTIMAITPDGITINRNSNNKKDEPVDPLKALADDLTIDVPRLKFALGMPLIKCDVATSLAAKKAYSDTKEGSEEELTVLLQWIELEGDLDVLAIMDEIMENFPHIQDIFYSKWDSVALEAVKTSPNFKENLLELWEKTPAGMEAEVELIKKLYVFYPKKLV
jgi:hypothetical protein